MAQVCVRGVRGAVAVDENTAAAILAATQELLIELQKANSFTKEDVVSAIFTVTPDLTAAFPARGARELGWTTVPMLCAQEIPVPEAPAGIVRVLLHIRTEREPEEIRHIYLGRASQLRRDLS